MLGAMNGDFKKRKKENPIGLVSFVGDILVHRVRRLSIFCFY